MNTQFYKDIFEQQKTIDFKNRNEYEFEIKMEMMSYLGFLKYDTCRFLFRSCKLPSERDTDNSCARIISFRVRTLLLIRGSKIIKVWEWESKS